MNASLNAQYRDEFNGFCAGSGRRLHVHVRVRAYSTPLSPPSPFDLLPPPTTVGFLKLSRPCCYVFPAGRGDCAFFAVNGFTVLVDGGSDSQACFWKLVRHLDRVDAVLLTHIGTENLPGVNVFLERKVAELELSSDSKGKKSSQFYSYNPNHKFS